MRRQFLRSACAALGLILAACSSSSSNGSTPPTGDSTTPSTESSVTQPVTVPDTVTPSSGPPTSGPVVTDPVTTEPAATESVRVYLLVGERLQVFGRAVASSSPAEAVRALLAGPTATEAAAGAVTLIPDGTRLNGVVVDGHEATVDLSGEFGTGGGSLSVMGRVAEVVYTVTQFDGIDTVRFAIDGTVVTELTGEGFGVDRVQRLDVTDLVPFILMETPWAGATVAQPITVSGMSNTFEAQVNYELLSPSGAVLVEGWFMATSGTGTWGTFAATLDPLPAGTTGDVTVRLFEVSPEDGAHISVTEAVVHLA